MGSGNVTCRVWEPARATLIAVAIAATFGSSAALAQLAVPGPIIPPAVNLGNVHVGGAFGTQALTVTNVAPLGYESLLTLFMPHPGPITLSGGTFVPPPISGRLIGPVAPGASNSSLLVGLNDTATAGPKLGGVTATYASQSAGGVTTVLPDSLNQTILVQGNVYRLAQPNTITTPVNLGIAHVGGSFGTQSLTVSNGATNDGYSEKLNAGVGYLGGDATSSGSVSLLAPGSSSTALSVGLGNANMSVAGLKSGQVGIGFASNGTGTSGFGNTPLAASQLVTVNGQVNNYAMAVLNQSGAGSFGGSGTSYTLNFGTIVQGSGSPTALLSVLNNGGSASFTDVLNGSFTLPGGAAFILSGFGSFSSIAGGSSTGPYSIALNDATAGSFAQTLYLNWNGSNGGGYSGPNTQISLNLLGNVTPVPEPHEWAMMLAGLGLIGEVARRRRKQ